MSAPAASAAASAAPAAAAPAAAPAVAAGPPRTAPCRRCLWALAHWNGQGVPQACLEDLSKSHLPHWSLDGAENGHSRKQQMPSLQESGQEVFLRKSMPLPVRSLLRSLVMLLILS